MKSLRKKNLPTNKWPRKKNINPAEKEVNIKFNSARCSSLAYEYCLRERVWPRPIFPGPRAPHRLLKPVNPILHITHLSYRTETNMTASQMIPIPIKKACFFSSSPHEILNFSSAFQEFILHFSHFSLFFFFQYC